jgi:hypothetical protein
VDLLYISKQIPHSFFGFGFGVGVGACACVGADTGLEDDIILFSGVMDEVDDIFCICS